MAIEEHTSWRELCHAALEAKDPNELLEIVQELNKALKHEEQVRRDFREARREEVFRKRPRLIVVGKQGDAQTSQHQGADANVSWLRGSIPCENLCAASTSCQRTSTSSTIGTVA
jgi:hypothetical protein